MDPNSKENWSENNLSSIHFSDKTILSTILVIYGDIEYDCTYNLGSIWKGFSRPEITGDIFPRDNNCREINIENTPFKDLEINSILWDPPFIMKNTDIPSRMMDRYGYFKSPGIMFDHFDKSIREISRILKKKGILVVKIQDVIDGSRRYFSHVRIANTAREYGLELRDIFIKVNMNLPTFRKSKNLSRANHCYWMVFKKTSRKIRNEKI